jgi:hypothetical protein
MTEEEKLDLLQDIRERLYQKIYETDFGRLGTSEFLVLLQTLDTVVTLIDKTHHEVGELQAPSDAEENRPEEKAPEADAAEATAEKPEPTQTPDPPKTANTPEYTMVDVRKKLLAARAKGVNVSTIVRSFGVENFQDIDATRYPEVIAALETEVS